MYLNNDMLIFGITNDFFFFFIVNSFYVLGTLPVNNIYIVSSGLLAIKFLIISRSSLLNSSRYILSFAVSTFFIFRQFKKSFKNLHLFKVV